MLKSLEALCAAVETGSLSLAADRLHLTQPAVSKQIRVLEDELGVQLLVRGARGVELTPVGRHVHRMARRAVVAAEGCRRAAAAWKDPDHGRLVVAAGSTLTLFTLPPVIQAFRTRVPGVRLDVVTGDSRECLNLLLGFEADVALVTSAFPHPEVQAIPLFTDPVVAAAAPGTALPATVAEMQGATLISFRGGSGLRQYVDQVLEARAVRPEVVMEFDSVEAIKTMVELGLGVALLPWSAVRADAAAGRLAAGPLRDWPDAGRTVTLLRRRAGLRAGPVAPFTAIAREVLRKSRPEGDTPS
ncbi:MAG TPA: LysR family transcriptional regulator [Symbiobacteriaceae bacterium]|nr:LysR family transcriptional regulator [Symbiobacteriaceae bacterium]